jgi:hypothetical protein
METMDVAIRNAQDDLGVILDHPKGSLKGQVVPFTSLRPKDPAHAINVGLRELEKRAKNEDFEVNFIDHPDQPIYEFFQAVDDMHANPGLGQAATRSDLNYSGLDKILGSITGAYAKSQNIVNPANRLIWNTQNASQDIFRILSGSASQVTRASAKNWRTNKRGTTAEGHTEKLRDRAADWGNKFRRYYSEARRASKEGAGINYNGETHNLSLVKGQVEFERLLMNYVHTRHDARMGYRGVKVPADVHKTIVDAADEFDNYFGPMGEELKSVGLLPEDGPTTPGLHGDVYSPIVFEPRSIRTDPAGFVDSMTAAFREKQRLIGGRYVDPDAIPIDPRVATDMNTQSGKNLFAAFEPESPPLPLWAIIEEMPEAAAKVVRETHKRSPQEAAMLVEQWNQGKWGADLAHETVPPTTAGSVLDELAEGTLGQIKDDIAAHPDGVRMVDHPRPGLEKTAFEESPDITMGGFKGDKMPVAAWGPTRELIIGNQRRQAQYVLYDIEDALPSHDPRLPRDAVGGGFQRKPPRKNPETGVETKPDPNSGRFYSDLELGPESIGTVKRISQAPKFDELYRDVPTSDVGVGWMARTGAVVSGNGRTQGKLLLYEGNFKDAIEASALTFWDELGAELPPKLPNKPDVALILLDPGNPDSLSRAANQGQAAGYSALGGAAARGSMLSTETLASLGRLLEGKNGERLTLRDGLNQNAKRTDAFITQMVEDGALTKQDITAMYGRSGKLNIEGKTKLELALMSKILGNDLDVLSEASDSVVKKVGAIVPELIDMNHNVDTHLAWNTIRVRMPEFVTAHHAWKASNQTWGDFFFRMEPVQGMNPFFRDAKAAVMAHALDRSGTLKFRKSMQDYLDDVAPMRNRDPNQPSLMDVDRPAAARTDESFISHFGEGIDDAAFRSHMESGLEVGGFLKGSLIGSVRAHPDDLRSAALAAHDYVFTDLVESAGRPLAESEVAYFSGGKFHTEPTGAATDVRHRFARVLDDPGEVDYTYPIGTSVRSVIEDIRGRVEKLRESVDPDNKSAMDDIVAAEAALKELGKAKHLEPEATITLDLHSTKWDLYSRVKSKQRSDQVAQGLSPDVLQTRKDYLGFQLKIDDVGQVPGLIDKLTTKGYRLLEQDDLGLASNFNKGGWRSISLKLQTPDRTTAVEVQLVPRTFVEVNAQAHAAYEIVRLAEVIAHDGNTFISSKQANALNVRMNELSDAAIAQWADPAQGSYVSPRSSRGIPAESILDRGQESMVDPGQPAPSVEASTQPSPSQRSSVLPAQSPLDTTRTRPSPPTSPQSLTSSRSAMGTSTRSVPADEPFVNYLKGVTEGDLPNELRGSYRAQLESYQRKSAERLKDAILEPMKGHGVIQGLEGTAPHLRNRTLNIPYSMVAPYLDDSATKTVMRYSHQVSGKIGVRRALQDNRESLAHYEKMIGRQIKTLDDAKEVIDLHYRTMQRMADIIGDEKLSTAIEHNWSKVHRDLFQSTEAMMGRNPVRAATDHEDFFAFFGRQLLRYNFMNKLGSVGWAQMNDIAPHAMTMAQNPRNFQSVLPAMGWVKNVARKDLEFLGLFTDKMQRSKAITDLDHDSLDYGYGGGNTKIISGAIDFLNEKGVDVSGHISAMNWMTNTNKRLAGMLLLERAGTLSKKMIRASRLMDEGLTEAQALKKVRMSNYQMSKMNHLGFNVDTAHRWHRMTYTRGDIGWGRNKGKPIRENMSWDQYLKNEKHLFLPNFDEWNTNVRANRHLLDTTSGRFRDEVNRHQVVTPGFYDKPLINFHKWGQLLNQFQTFMMAFLGQRLVPMSQMPAHYQGWYYMNYMALGGLTDAITNHLSGRRSFDETWEGWRENPLGMSYKAFVYSGLSGPINRVWGVMDALGFGPGNLVDNVVGGGASQGFYYGDVAARTAIQALGPTGTSVTSVLDVGHDLLGPGETDYKTAYRAATMVPFQNQAILRLMYRSFGLPVVPQYITEQHKRQRGIRR